MSAIHHTYNKYASEKNGGCMETKYIEPMRIIKNRQEKILGKVVVPMDELEYLQGLFNIRVRNLAKVGDKF